MQKLAHTEHLKCLYKDAKFFIKLLKYRISNTRRSQWPRGLMRRSTAARLLRS
jgi:hypothetical protein